MDSRSLIIVVVVVLGLILLTGTCKRIDIRKKSNDQRTTVSLDIEKRKADRQ